MKKIDFKKLLNKLKPTKGRGFKTISAKAHHDWKMMVITFFLFWIFMALGSGYMLLEIQRGNIFQADKKEDTVQAVLNKKLIDETTQFFDVKKIQLEKLKTEKPNTTDPSL